MSFESMTVSEVIDRYINAKCAVLSPSTIRGYRAYSKKYYTDISETSICELNKESLQCWVNNISKLHSPKTVKNAYGLLSAALTMFHPDFDKIKVKSLPRNIKAPFYVPDKKEIQNIYCLLKGTNLEVPFLLASKCGLRPSEIAALTTDCVVKCTIEIRKAMVMDENGNQVLKPPKTNAGYRSIPIPQSLEDLLISRADGNMICALSANRIGKEWSRFLAENNLRYFKFYALRHYFASQALLLGIPQKYIAEMMGHSSTQMIEHVYQHIMKYAMDEFKERIKNDTRELMDF